MSTYNELLRTSAKATRNILCMGLDPQRETLPFQSGDVRKDICDFFETVFSSMKKEAFIPAAFKPNIGYYQALDNPRKKEFAGSLALSDVLDMLESFFPGIPVILDSKRGDIARSSLNYALEAFSIWQTHAVTVSPYMGTDSVEPFLTRPECGVYLLNRTSNPGAKDLQNLTVIDEIDEKELYPLYLAVAHKIAVWNAQCAGTAGAVVGATSLLELEEIASYYADKEVPLLIPGVGSQGGSAPQTMTVLKESGYPIELARINSSSALTHPWKTGPAPTSWLSMILKNLATIQEETMV